MVLPMRDGANILVTPLVRWAIAPRCQGASQPHSPGYFLAGRVCMIRSISAISRGALLIRSSPAAVIT
jgi:2-keto-3-deoxy-6-phosphogluconate aldolase